MRYKYLVLRNTYKIIDYPQNTEGGILTRKRRQYCPSLLCMMALHPFMRFVQMFFK